MTLNLHKMILPVAVLAAIGGIVFSCSAEDGPLESTFDVSVSPSPVNYDVTTSWISVKAATSWTLSYTEDSEWLTAIYPAEGSGNKGDVRLAFTKNTGKETRYAKIILTSADGSLHDTCTFAQFAKNTEEVKDSPLAAWLELPEMVEGANVHFISHSMTLGSKKTRNFAICYDTGHLVSHWVAYPLNAWLMQGKSGRSEVWGNLDPAVPRKLQAYVPSPYNGRVRPRGHQIPSADRQVLEYNKQTYYGTNMVPQDYTLNGETWARLEGKVRTWANKFDTLYVATGCILDGSTTSVYDSDNKKVTVPVAFFKALMGYDKQKKIGQTGKCGGYTGIGFYFKNQAYTGDCMNEAMTLSELEDKTGFTFFTNLPSVIGETLTDKMKTTKDTWWWN